MIDSHAHLTSDAIYPQVDAVLERARSAGITAIINICTDLKTLQRGLELHKRYPWVYNAASTTPHDVEKEGEALFETMAEAARSKQLVAVGETGLDYHYTHSPKDLQKEFLRRYLALAAECNLPVVIHCREAFADFFSILDQAKPVRGVLHCFTGSGEEALEVVKRNWFVSFSGIVTFKKSEELREAARLVPLENLLIETDAPYLAPQLHRGKQNEPSFLGETAKLLAELKQVSVEEMILMIHNNAKKLFYV
jgi:TatD DNase family protein